MKKIVASVGLVALGASSIQAGTIPGLTAADGGKPWSVSATLRGFYDDNINTVADNDPLHNDTFGFEVSPSVRFGWSLPQTAMSLGYTYSMKWYEERPAGQSDRLDHTHTFNAALQHAFTERYVLSLRNSFVIGQEPDFLRTDHSMSTVQRISGDNIRNFGAAAFNAQLTRLFGLEVGYSNAYFNYDDSGPGSRSAFLDRMVHSVHLDTRWQVLPQTVGIVGYRYGQTDYTADEDLDVFESGEVFSDDRNNRSHYGYVGVEHSFRPDFTGAVRVGARYTDFYNSDVMGDEWGPYAQASLRYTFLPESHIEAGVTHDRSATDRISFDGDSFTTDAETTVVYATVSHRIVPRLYGNLTGQFQNSTFHGGALDDETEQYYLLGLNLEYRFNPNFSAHVGYNYDKLDSDRGRTFDRNRVYTGITASY